MSKTEPAKVQDLKDAIDHMINDHNLPLGARVEVYLGDDLYYIDSISHWHIEPNLQLEIYKAEEDKVSTVVNIPIETIKNFKTTSGDKR